MSIALRNTSSASVAAAGTLTLNVPTGVQNGDVMVVIVNTTTGTFTPPAGWTQITANGTSPLVYYYYRVASSEPASYGWTVPGIAVAACAAYSGENQSTPINANSANAHATANPVVATGVTTTVNGCELLFVAGWNNITALTPPTGFVVEVTANDGSGRSVAIADASQSAAGATGNESGSTATTGQSNSILVALAPAAAAAPSNTVAPVVSGSATVGSTLSTDDGTWTGSPTSFTYQWTSGGVDISAATSSTYVSQAGDVGNAIGCTVTATNAGGSASQASSNTITVTAAASLSTVAGKTGTSGTAVMQKAASGWTYITGKTGTSGTAVDQKGAGSFTKIKGH